MKNNGKEHYVNEDIRTLCWNISKQVRVIGPEGEQLGVMTLGSAQKSAYDRELDLVLIAPQSEPPVCKIIDYGRFRFERDKRDKEAKKKQQIAEIKEIQLSCHIDTNDFNTKVNHARRFLSGGDKVRVIVRFRGRQMAHQDIGRELLAKFAEICADVGNVDKTPLLEGRSLTMFLGPLKKDAAVKTADTDKAKAPAANAEAASAEAKVSAAQPTEGAASQNQSRPTAQGAQKPAAQAQTQKAPSRNQNDQG